MAFGIPLHRLPPIEFRKFKSIDFFPPPPLEPGEVARWNSICIGTKNRTIGDSLILSTLPGKLKARFPSLRIHVYPRGFNRAVFAYNPHVDGVAYLPDLVFGDDANLDSGHLIQLKETHFGLPRSAPPRPEIYLSDAEREWARRLSGPASPEAAPIVVLHAWGHTQKDVASPRFWEDLVRPWSGRVRFWQVGVEGQAPIEGCEKHFLLPRAFRHARKLFALMDQARGFIGVDSGPMHVARAFDLPSLILLRSGDSREVFRNRAEAPYFLRGNRKGAFLYEENRHLELHRQTPAEIEAGIRSFLDGLSRPRAA